MTKTRQGGVPYSDDWHTFGVEWSKDRITGVEGARQGGGQARFGSCRSSGGRCSSC